MVGGAGSPLCFPSSHLSLPTPRSCHESDIEDSPELPVSVLPFPSSGRDAFLTPGPLPGPTQTHRQLPITQDPRQDVFGTWKLGLGMQEHGSRTTHTSQPLAVARLDHNTLFIQNQLYRDLYSENIHLKSQLEYTQQMFASVLRNPNHSMQSVQSDRHAFQVDGQPQAMSGSTLSSSNLRELLMPLDKAKYPGVNYWRKNEWIKRPTTTTTTVVNTQTGVKGRKRRAAGINVNCGFVEDEHGIPVDGYRITAISNRLREIWRECYGKGIAPVTWGKGVATFRDFVRMQMYDYAPELRLCEDHWKLDMIATTNYPGWYRKHVLGDDSEKEDGGDLDKENRDKHNDTYMYLPQKRGSTVAPPASKKKKKLKVPISVETSAINSAEIPTPPASASSCNSVASTPFTSNVKLPALSDVTFEQGLPDPHGDLPVVSMDAVGADQINNTQTPDTKEPGMELLHPQVTPLVTATQEPANIELPRVAPLVPGTQEPADNVDPFAAMQAVVATVNKETTASSSTGKGKKKIYKPTKAVTPLNLFAKDHCPKNPVTKPELDIAWNELTENQKRAYEQKSSKIKQDIKEAKAAAAKAAKAAAS